MMPKALLNGIKLEDGASFQAHLFFEICNRGSRNLP